MVVNWSKEKMGVNWSKMSKWEIKAGVYWSTVCDPKHCPCLRKSGSPYFELELFFFNGSCRYVDYPKAVSLS